MTLVELADAYLAGAAQLREAVAGMTHEQLIARPVPGKWSTLEVVAHVSDFEPIMADRIKRVASTTTQRFWGLTRICSQRTFSTRIETSTKNWQS